MALIRQHLLRQPSKQLNLRLDRVRLSAQVNHSIFCKQQRTPRALVVPAFHWSAT